MGRSRSSAAAKVEAPEPVAPVALLPEPTEMLGELLVRGDRISPGQLAEALFQQSASGKRIGALLVELGVLDDHDLAEALAEQFELELADLRRNTPDADAVALLPEVSARRFTAIPLRLDGESLVVAVADVSSETLSDLRRRA
jgi:type IV pilus assembly protein PilB